MKTFKVTTYLTVIDKKENLQRRVYTTLKGGMTWQEAKEYRGRGMFIVPEVIHEYQDSE